MVIFIVNCNRDFILLTNHSFDSFAHASYTLVRLITVFGFVKFYFEKTSVFLYIKGSVIVESDLAIYPCINE